MYARSWISAAHALWLVASALFVSETTASGIESSNGDFRVGALEARPVIGDACTDAGWQGVTSACTIIRPDQWDRPFCVLANDGEGDPDAASVGLVATFYASGKVPLLMASDYAYPYAAPCASGDLQVQRVPEGAVEVAMGAPTGHVSVWWWSFSP